MTKRNYFFLFQWPNNVCKYILTYYLQIHIKIFLKLYMPFWLAQIYLVGLWCLIMIWFTFFFLHFAFSLSLSLFSLSLAFSISFLCGPVSVCINIQFVCQFIQQTHVHEWQFWHVRSSHFKPDHYFSCVKFVFNFFLKMYLFYWRFYKII